MSINRRNATTPKQNAADARIPAYASCALFSSDCLELLKALPDESVQLILLDPPYNLDLAAWDVYADYIEWAAQWIEEAYRVLAINGNMAVFGGTQYRDVRSGDLIDILYHCRHHTKLRLVNTIIWHYKNGMSAQRYFANRHEEIIWLTKSNAYYFDLDAVRVPYGPREMERALKDKRLNPEQVLKGKNPTNVWEIGRLNGNSLERVGHPTQKPVELIRRLVKALSYPGAVVLDFFAGSGTTGRVCIEEGRNCILCDKDPQTPLFFQRHIEKMRQTPLARPFHMHDTLEGFFEEIAVPIP